MPGTDEPWMDAKSGYAMNAARLSLITRVDDAGLCESVNDAVLDVAASGLVRNVSIMAAGPALAHLAERLRGRSDLCLGLHVTLNAEWERVRWRPLSPLSRGVAWGSTFSATAKSASKSAATACTIAPAASATSAAGFDGRCSSEILSEKCPHLVSCQVS